MSRSWFGLATLAFLMACDPGTRDPGTGGEPLQAPSGSPAEDEVLDTSSAPSVRREDSGLIADGDLIVSSAFGMDARELRLAVRGGILPPEVQPDRAAWVLPGPVFGPDVKPVQVYAFDLPRGILDAELTPDAKQPVPDVIRITLPDHGELVLDRSSVDRFRHAAVWTGLGRNLPAWGNVVQTEHVLYGRVDVMGDSFVFVHDGKQGWLVRVVREEVAEAHVPFELKGETPEGAAQDMLGAATYGGSGPNAGSGPPVIDLLIGVTRAFFDTHAGSTPLANELLDAIVTERLGFANATLANSQITYRYRLVDTRIIEFNETKITQYGLGRLLTHINSNQSSPVTGVKRLVGASLMDVTVSEADPVLTFAEDVRDEVGADIIGILHANVLATSCSTNLLVPFSPSCTGAEGFVPGGGADTLIPHPDLFSSLVRQRVGFVLGTSVANFSHELGHNLGANHDWLQNSDCESGDSVESVDVDICINRGHIAADYSWWTVMAYPLKAGRDVDGDGVQDIAEFNCALADGTTGVPGLNDRVDMGACWELAYCPAYAPGTCGGTGMPFFSDPGRTYVNGSGVQVPRGVSIATPATSSDNHQTITKPRDRNYGIPLTPRSMSNLQFAEELRPPGSAVHSVENLARFYFDRVGLESGATIGEVAGTHAAVIDPTGDLYVVAPGKNHDANPAAADRTLLDGVQRMRVWFGSSKGSNDRAIGTFEYHWNYATGSTYPTLAFAFHSGTHYTNPGSAPLFVRVWAELATDAWYFKDIVYFPDRFASCSDLDASEDLTFESASCSTFGAPCSVVSTAAGPELLCTFKNDGVGSGLTIGALTTDQQRSYTLLANGSSQIGSSDPVVSVTRKLSTYVVEAWRTGDNTRYCCAYDDDARAIRSVEIVGSDLDDTMYASEKDDFDARSPESSMARLAPLVTVSSFDLELRAENGIDTVIGSCDDRAWVHETLGGGTGADKLYGMSGADTIRGFTGNDHLFGMNGSDLLVGHDDVDTLWGDWNESGNWAATGSDTLQGGNHNDTLRGGPGADRLEGLAGADTLFGDADADDLFGGTEGDTLWGGAGDDELSGESGVDFLHGEAGSDLLSGGTQDDDLFGEDENDILHGDDGIDELWGGSGNDLLFGEAGTDVLFCGAGDDYAWGGDHVDIVWGEAGDDILSGGLGADEVSGGDNNDSIDGNEDNDLLEGDAGLDEIWGSAGDDDIDGGSGDDKLHGGIGADDLWGSSGADTMWGGDGGDHLYGGAESDVIDGGNHVDGLYGGDGSDILCDSTNIVYMDGEAGYDFLRWMPPTGFAAFNGGAGLNGATCTTGIQSFAANGCSAFFAPTNGMWSIYTCPAE